MKLFNKIKNLTSVSFACKHNNEWNEMTGVLGLDSARVSLYWEGDNLS